MSLRSASALFLTVLGIGAVAEFEIAEAATKKVGKVKGIVTTKGLGPTANVTVTVTVQLLTNPGMGKMPLLVGTKTTDAHGHFEFDDIAPGKYTVGALWTDIYVYKEILFFLVFSVSLSCYVLD